MVMTVRSISKSVGTKQCLLQLAGKPYHGRGIEHGGGNAGDHVVEPGPLCPLATPTPPVARA